MSAILYSPAPLAVLSFRLVLPLRGAWYAQVELDATPAQVPADGAIVTLALSGRGWIGYVVRSRSWHGRVRLMIEAGRGGMRAVLPARAYESALVRTMIEHAVAEAGEALSSASDSTDVVGSHSRANVAAGHALTSILKGRDLEWRFDDDGRVKVARETWPAAPTTDVFEQEPFGDTGSTLVAPLAPTLSPGTTWAGRRIAKVVYTLAEGDGESLEAELVFAHHDSAADMRDLFRRACLAAVPEVPFLSRFGAVIASQDTDGRVALVPDSATHGGTGSVPVVYGLPGTSARLPEGSRVGLAFDGGDREKAYATGFDAAAPAEEIAIDATTIKLGASATRGVVRLDERGDAGTFTAGPGAPTLIWTSPIDPLDSWGITLTAGGTPVTAVVAPIGGGSPGVILTRASRASDKVKAE